MSLKIFNSLTRKEEEFQSIEDKKVKMYVCGPTVYDLLHVGNFRGAILFNMVRNWLEHLGYTVTYVYNYTDIDDKIIKRANESDEDPLKLSERFIGEFEKDFARLGLKKHDHNPRCTHYIDDMTAMIQNLVDKGHAYVIEGEVFFSIESFKGYGQLSGKNIEDLQAGHRVDPDPRKKSPLDFVLWKPAKEGEPGWDSPWGTGRPGWHIECSTMSHVLLGDSIDIHGGGIDLTFPHHENEIAQSEASSDKPFARYWMHNNFINFGDSKMSKSLGNVVKARDFMDQFNPEILKFMMLSVHYRSPLNLSDSQVHQAIGRLDRIYSAVNLADQIIDQGIDAQEDKAFRKELTAADAIIEAALNDDFNTPKMFAAVFDVVRLVNSAIKPGQKAKPLLVDKAEVFKEWLRRLGENLALFQEPAAGFLKELDQIMVREKDIDVNKVDELIQQRNQARADKDFKEADRLRDELIAMDVIVNDGINATTWEVKKG